MLVHQIGQLLRKIPYFISCCHYIKKIHFYQKKKLTSLSEEESTALENLVKR